MGLSPPGRTGVSRNSGRSALVGIEGENPRDLMTATAGPRVGQIHSLLAERGYEVSDPAADTFKITEVESGVSIQVVLQGDILYFSLVCTVVPRSAVTADVMSRMLDAANGISTSYFQLYDA